MRSYYGDSSFQNNLYITHDFRRYSTEKTTLNVLFEDAYIIILLLYAHRLKKVKTLSEEGAFELQVFYVDITDLIGPCRY